ncbi:hypothetical protein BDZ89DRAFT_914127, partial [Hymenopellis radicata]
SVLKSDDLGPTFVALMKAWYELEKAHGFTNTTRDGLPAHSRPALVSAWIKNGRRTRVGANEKENDKTDRRKFVTQFQEWWRSVQPDWRTLDLNGDWSQKKGERDSFNLRARGTNGLSGVVGSLRWWKEELGNVTDGAEREREMGVWEKAATDAIWVIGQLRDE